MTQHQDASDKSDRATAADHVVSALRDGIPSAASLILRRDVIRDLPQRWANQYKHFSGQTMPWMKEHTATYEEIVRRLNALDLRDCDYAEIEAIMCNDSWSSLQCDICGGRDCDSVIRIGEEPDYEARWQDICLPCLASIGALAAQAIEARQGRGEDSVHKSAVATPCAKGVAP